MRMLRLPNCNVDNLACDISSELYGEYQQKAYGLKFCDISCRIGDVDERILLKYLFDSGIPLEQLLPVDQEKIVDTDILKTNEQLVKQPVIQHVHKTIINQITNQNASFVYVQSEASGQWIIIHNLGYFPNVSIVNTANEVVTAAIEYVNENQIIVNFNVPFIGKAYLS